MKAQLRSSILSISILLFSNQLLAQNDSIPFRVDSLFDMSQANTLGLKFAKDAETISIFTPDSSQNKYNHGLVLFPFKGMLYAQWQSSKKDEDASDTQVMYSRSADGKEWSTPLALTEVWNKGITTSGGWWSHGDSLIAYTCVWPDSLQPKGGYTEYRVSTDGLHWSQAKPVLNENGQTMNGIIEQDMRTLASGRLLTAFHMQEGLIITPYYTDDAYGIKRWKAGKMQNLPSKKETISREIEPSWFVRKDSAIVMIFRDQNSTFKKLAAISFDQGENWSTPVLIDTPDSRAKQSAGNLPDGTAFMVNNPSGSKSRFPLVITLSKDGFVFDKAILLRSGGDDLQAQRYQGKYKRAGYSYPKSIVWNGYLYVGYATNKEDVELTRISLKELEQK